MARPGRSIAPIRRALFLGSKRLGLAALKAAHQAEPERLSAVVAVDDRADGRSCLGQFAEYAAAHGLEFHCVGAAAEAKRIVLAAQPDICLASGWYWIFDRATVDAVPRGIVGLHNSLLPKYRGGAPLVWALINGETEVGFSLFCIGHGVDDGDVIAQRAIAVRPHDDIADVLARLEAVISADLPAIWREILAGAATARPQDHAAATVYRMRKPADGAIDWTKPAARLYDFIRAQAPPYPGAFTTVAGQRVAALRADIAPPGHAARPGEVLASTAEGVLIACGGGSILRLTQVLTDGLAQPAAAALPAPGARLPS